MKKSIISRGDLEWPFSPDRKECLLINLTTSLTLRAPFFPESKDYAYTTKALGSTFKTQPQEGRGFKRAVRTISKALFTEATPLLTHMAGSKLMKGMAQDKIKKTDFYHFLGQDSIHLKNGEEILRQTANVLKSSPDDLSFVDMYTKQADKYQKSYTGIDSQLKTYANVDPTTIEPNLATTEYYEFLTSVSVEHPRLLGFAFLPCSQSFRYIANQLLEETQDPVYKNFFEANKREMGYRSDLEKFIDERFPLESLQKDFFKVIEKTYLEGMQHEKTFIDYAALDCKKLRKK